MIIAFGKKNKWKAYALYKDLKVMDGASPNRIKPMGASTALLRLFLCQFCDIRLVKISATKKDETLLVDHCKRSTMSMARQRLFDAYI